MEFLFGVKPKRRKPVRRYNVKGSPCNKLKRSTCKTTKGCNYVKRRGCRRARGYANMVAEGLVPMVNAQVMDAAKAGVKAAEKTSAPPEAILAAGVAAAADAASTNVLAVGGTPEEAHEAAVQAAEDIAPKIAEQINVEPKQAEEIIKTISKAPFTDGVNGLGDLAAEIAAGKALKPINCGEGMVFRNGKCRSIKRQTSGPRPESELDCKYRGFKHYDSLKRECYSFGSGCSTLLPKDINTCLNYNVDGMYPCNWSGGKNNRCQARVGGSVPYSIASTSGMYMKYVIALTPDLETIKPPPPVIPVSPIAESLSEKCKMMNEADCRNQLNCSWVGGNVNRCQARKGTIGENLRWSGPIRQNTDLKKQAMEEASELMFGRRYKFGKEDWFGPKHNCVNKNEKEYVKCVADFFKKNKSEILKPAPIVKAEKIEKNEDIQPDCGEGMVFRNGNCRPIKREKNEPRPESELDCKYRGFRHYNSLKKECYSFGRRRRHYKRRKTRKTSKIPAKIRKLCKRLKIKTTKKVGGRRVRKSLKVLMKQIKQKMRKLKRKTSKR